MMVCKQLGDGSMVDMFVRGRRPTWRWIVRFRKYKIALPPWIFLYYLRVVRGPFLELSVSNYSIMELLGPTTFLINMSRYPCYLNDGDFWELQKTNWDQFADMVNSMISPLETTHDDPWVAVAFCTKSGDGRLNTVEEPRAMSLRLVSTDNEMRTAL